MTRQTGQIFNPYRLFYGVFIPEGLLRFPGVSPGAKLCYGRLARYAGERGVCWPLQCDLARELGVSVRNVRRYLQELQSEFFIRARQRGLNRSNEYEFLWHKTFEGSERTNASAPEKPKSSAPERPRLSAPSIRESFFSESTTTAESAGVVGAVARRGKRGLSRIQPDDAAEIYEKLRGAENRRGAIG